jgi:hypothetical protein
MSKLESAVARLIPEKRHLKLVSEQAPEKQENAAEASQEHEALIPESKAWEIASEKYEKLNKEFAQNQEIRTKLKKLGTKPTAEFLNREKEAEAEFQHLDGIIKSLKKGRTEEQARKEWHEGATTMVENPFFVEKVPEEKKPSQEELRARHEELWKENARLNLEIQKAEGVEQVIVGMIKDIQGAGHALREAQIKKGLDALRSIQGDDARLVANVEAASRNAIKSLDLNKTLEIVDDKITKLAQEKGRVLVELSDTAAAMAASREADETEENEPIPLRRKKNPVKKAA